MSHAPIWQPPMWQPSAAAIARSHMTGFTRAFAAAREVDIPDYAALQQQALAEPARFWQSFLDWSGLLVSGEREPAIVGRGIEDARFFPRLGINYAENLLFDRDPTWATRPAILALDETGHRIELTRAELRAQVASLRHALVEHGLCAGDRVVAVARNTASTVVAALAVTSLGATWSSASPDMGIEAALSRFRQLEPRMLFAHTSFPYQGRSTALTERIERLVGELPSLRTVVALDDGDLGQTPIPVARARLADLVKGATPTPSFERWPFDAPLFILFSSGTTGAPKCIVHGHGGTLLEHHKELALHCDLRPEDTLFFQTSTGWMMWNWQLSALAHGARIVLYDGSVTHPERDSLLRIVAREKVTVFGTNPAYLQYLEDAEAVPANLDLGALRAVLSTGSILFGRHYDFVWKHLAKVPVMSISGGTDIIGCFVLGNPNLPVYRGESQCVSLGLDVRVVTAAGAARVGRGELVCVAPMPSRPVGLFGDDGARFHAAYFADNEGMWTHGDLLELTERGTALVLGRSDGVLNIRGIRLGPAEIYDVLTDVPEISATMAVDQADETEPGGRRLVLLVVLREGLELDRALSLRIKKFLKERASAVHVPAVVAQVCDLPTTHSGKRSERAVQDALNGREVRNRSALRNPEAIDAIVRHPALARSSPA